MKSICNKQHLALFAAQIIKKLSNTGTEVKKGVAYKKRHVNGLTSKTGTLKVTSAKK